jgi:hypothetical protein
MTGKFATSQRIPLPLRDSGRLKLEFKRSGLFIHNMNDYHTQCGYFNSSAACR